MIRLCAISKVYDQDGPAPKLVFRPTTIDLPADGCVGILGRRGLGKSTLLHLLARIEAPDRGVILAPKHMSPLINSGGVFHPQLSAIDNVAFLARAYGVDPDWMLAAAEALDGAYVDLYQPLRAQPPVFRRSLEAAIVTVLPFDCYLFDDPTQFAPAVFDRCVNAIRQRRSGVVFATANPSFLRRFAQFAVVIDDYTLHPFEHAKEAIEFFDQRSR